MPNNYHHKQGLKERIKIAQTSVEIQSLLVEGASYQAASEVTKRAWHRAAARRTQELADT